MDLSKLIETVKENHYTSLEYSEMLVKGFFLTEDTFEKSADKSKLTQKKVWVTKNGKTYQTTVWVKEGEEPKVKGKSKDVSVGESIGETKGMDIVRYSEKAILIKGDTYANKETMQEIKKDLGVGSYNGKLKGWVFPVKYLSNVLGNLFSKAREAGDDGKADAIQNQKNELPTGTEVNVGGIEGKVTEGASTSEGVKYNIKTELGELNGVDESMVGVEPAKDTKEIAKIVNQNSPDSRIKVEKQLYGIKPMADIHKLSLSEYMEAHGLSKQDIDKALNRLKPKEEGSKKKTSSGGGSSKPKAKAEGDGLTKQQLISKLIYNHYQAVKKAIDAGKEVPASAVATYSDLTAEELKSRKPMSEETKRKISEALKKNKVDENPKAKPVSVSEESPKKESTLDDEVKELMKWGAEKVKFNPKEGEPIIVPGRSNFQGEEDISIKTKDYTHINARDLRVPSKKNILKEPIPSWIPKIDMYEFERKKHTFEAVKIGEDRYAVALNGFTRGQSYMLTNSNINTTDGIATMSLDLLVATQNYYRMRAAAIHKRKEDAAIEERKQNLRDRGYDPEKYKFKRSRIKIMSDNRMTHGQAFMIQRLSSEYNDPENKGVRNFQWKVQSSMVSDMKQKSIDLNLQTEYEQNAHSKGKETSYGDSGTKDNLLKDYGVKVKRQNGDEISDSEIGQIKSALDSVGNVFGVNKSMNKDFGLKISHSGDVLMHARKAIGIFSPAHNAIGVSAIDGDSQFKTTFAHEYGHFMDNYIGNKTGHNYASDKQGSTANKIASTFRRLMNKPQKSDYYNRTCECLARAIEQHYEIKELKQGTYNNVGHHVKDEVFLREVAPLIERFLEENKEILKSVLNDLILRTYDRIK